ncbi:hypothetical protein [Eubacterium sp.]
MKKAKKIVKSLFIIIISALLLGFVIHTVYVQCHRAEVVEYLVDKYDFDKKDIVLLDYEGEKFHDDSDLGILFDWYTTSPTWKIRCNKRTFGVTKTKYGFSDDYQLEDIFEWSVDYLKTVDPNVVGIKINCGKLHNIVTKDTIKDFLINDNDSFVIYYKVNDLSPYRKLSKSGDSILSSEKYKTLRINILNKYLSICEDIEKKHVILVDTEIKFTRQKFDNFASYYYDTKTIKTELIERGNAIG